MIPAHPHTADPKACSYSELQFVTLKFFQRSFLPVEQVGVLSLCRIHNPYLRTFIGRLERTRQAVDSNRPRSVSLLLLASSKASVYMATTMEGSARN